MDLLSVNYGLRPVMGPRYLSLLWSPRNASAFPRPSDAVYHQSVDIKEY